MRSLSEKGNEISSDDSPTVDRYDTSQSEIEFIIGIDKPVFSLDNSNNFYVKFKNKKYKDCQWISTRTLKTRPSYISSLITPFKNKIKNMKLNSVPFVKNLYKPSDIIFKETYLNPISVLAHRQSAEEESVLYLVQWQDLPITSSTWETDVPAELLEAYNDSLQNPVPIQGQITDSFQDPENFIPIWESNVYKNSNKLTTYQVNGFNWLLDKWHNNHNSILADESGIGKTIQSIAVIEGINGATSFRGPYLIIAPLQCANKWIEELNKWTFLRVLNYTGDDAQIEMLNNYCLYLDSNRTELKRDVIVTSFETFKKRATDFSCIEWLCIFVDEIITKLKKNTQILKLIPTLSTDHLILLTKADVCGLRVEDVWCIFNLLEPDTFPSLDQFRNDFEESNSKLNQKKFSNLAQDYILRRTSEILDPLKNRTDKDDIVIEAEPTELQMTQFKKFILGNRSAFLNRSYLNEKLLITLRKISSHPFLIPDVYEKELSNLEKYISHELKQQQEAKLIVESSGKMIILDRLICRFRNLNKKVLVFSNMTAMADIIEIYLQKKGIPYERLNGSSESINISNPNSSTKNPTVFLSNIDDFQVDVTNADATIIYDSHFSCPQSMKQRVVFRILTRGTVEEDLFIRLMVGKKNKVLLTDEDLDFILRRNAYFAFFGQIDQSFITESIDKTLEYRTNPDFTFPEELNSTNFWTDLFSSPNSALNLDNFDIRRNELKAISKAMVNFGCYSTRKRFQKIEQLDFKISSLIFVLYKSIDKNNRQYLKKYVHNVFTISNNNAISKDILKEDPFNDRQFLADLFGGDKFHTMKKIFTYDRIYAALSFMSTPSFNDIGFVFAQSMSVPIFWNEKHDYVLLYSVYRYGALECDKELIVKSMKANNLPIPNLPSILWLKQRVILIVCEIESLIPTDFFAQLADSVHSIVPLKKWITSYRPKPTINFETRSYIKKVLLGLYLYGFPIERDGQQFWPHFQKMVHLNMIPLEVIKAIVHSLIKAASEHNPHLLELIRYSPIREINVSWIEKNVLVALSNQLILFRKMRAAVKKFKTEILTSSKFYISKWRIAPQWWDLKCDTMLLETVSKEGFLSLSLLMKLDHFKKLNPGEIKTIENEWMIERELLQPSLPRPLHDLEFMRSIDVRISRIDELCRFLLSPSNALLAQQLNSGQNTGLYIFNIGEPNDKGIPIGYIAKRFYRDEIFIQFLFYDCIVENDGLRNIPKFVIRGHSAGNKYVKVQAFSVARAYKLLLEQLIQKSITPPPSNFDGYDFFGFKNNFVRYCLESQNH